MVPCGWCLINWASECEHLKCKCGRRPECMPQAQQQICGSPQGEHGVVHAALQAVSEIVAGAKAGHMCMILQQQQLRCLESGTAEIVSGQWVHDVASTCRLQCPKPNASVSMYGCGSVFDHIEKVCACVQQATMSLGLSAFLSRVRRPWPVSA